MPSATLEVAGKLPFVVEVSKMGNQLERWGYVVMCISSPANSLSSRGPSLPFDTASRLRTIFLEPCF
ncbi:hypothetical protein P691DRAFT_803622 [Macrolepiota fuliginosa MF-IS2]|uniref:Uncharacterized protein n=1 Tax=Macrolepiota fuliginosa MF-IS2 TaxID=1400762 RepID=A0A9P6BZV0_9AGAR|nr:hypothetical protein P691DRAFT_803622 [Macrolepiota fuliginosa MF-IS2]